MKERLRSISTRLKHSRLRTPQGAIPAGFFLLCAEALGPRFGTQMVAPVGPTGQFNGPPVWFNGGAWFNGRLQRDNSPQQRGTSVTTSPVNAMRLSGVYHLPVRGPSPYCFLLYNFSYHSEEQATLGPHEPTWYGAHTRISLTTPIVTLYPPHINPEHLSQSHPSVIRISRRNIPCL